MMLWFFPAFTFAVVGRVAVTPELEEVGLTHRQGVWVGDTLILVYHARTAEGVYQIFLRRFTGGLWEAPFRLTHSTADAKWPSIVRDGQDSLHIAWHDYRVDGIRNVEIFYAACTPAFSCTPAIRVTYTSSGSVGDNSYVPVLLRGSGDTLHLVWYDFRDDPAAARARIYYTFRPPDALFDPTTERALSGVGVNARFPFLFRHADTLIALWEDNAAGPYQIRITRRTGSGWEVPTYLAPSASAQAFAHGTVWQNRMVAAFEEGGTVKVSRDGWGTLTVGAGGRPHLVPSGDRLWVIAQRDSAVVGWALDTSGVIRDSFRLDRPGTLAHVYAGVWGTLMPDGRLMLVWSESDGAGRDLVYAVSDAVAVVESFRRPIPAPRRFSVDLLGRSRVGRTPGVVLHGRRKKQVVFP